MSTFSYVGDELSVFKHATVWKHYFAKALSPYVSGRVLEVGAGIGATTEVLQAMTQSSDWVCLEPDAKLLADVSEKIKAGKIKAKAVLGTVSDAPHLGMFDTVLYVDVVEHLADDRAELERVAAHLKPGGRLLVLSPAHQFLFSSFDKEVGHYRRYNRETLRQAAPPLYSEVAIFYMDSVGLFASLANRLLLKQGHPSEKQIKFWDRCLVRVSRYVDPLLAHRFGKTIVGVWEKTQR